LEEKGMHHLLRYQRKGFPEAEKNKAKWTA